MTLLILLPLLISLVLLTSLSFQSSAFLRRFYALIVAVLLFFGIVLFHFPEISSSYRVVFILENPSLLLDTPDSLFSQVLKKLKIRSPKDSWILLLNPSQSQWESEFSKEQKNRPPFQSVSHLEQAFEKARFFFQESVAKKTFWERFRWYQHRILFIRSSTSWWKEQKLPPLDIIRWNKLCREEGIFLDLFVTETQAPQATLEILFSSNQIPAVHPLSQMEEVLVLRLKSPLLQRYKKQEISWYFQGKMNSSDPKETFILATDATQRNAGKSVVLETGFVEITVPLKYTKGASSGLVKGFHFLEAKLLVQHPHFQLVARQELYLRADFRRVFFIVGKDSNRFQRVQEAEAFYKQWIEQALYPAGIPYALLKTRKPASLTFQASDFFSIENYLKENSQSSPFLIVLYDIPQSFWDSSDPSALYFWKKIEQHVQGGAHLWIVGLPATPDYSHPLPPWYPLVPAFAKIPSGLLYENVPKASKIPWKIDRTPHLTFILDRSRLGRLPYKGMKPGEFVESQRSLQRLSSGMEWQLQIIEKLCQELAIQNPVPSLEKASYQEQQWIKSDVFIPPLLPESRFSPASSLDFIAASDINQRLAPLLPSELLQHFPTSFKLPEDYQGILPHPHRPLLHELAIRDVLILFTYELNQRDSFHLLTILLARGVTVFVVRLESPFSTAVNQEARESKVFPLDLSEYFKKELEDSRVTPLLEEQAWKVQHLKERFFEVPLKADLNSSSVDPLKVQEISTWMSERLLSFYAPQSFAMVPHRLGRFLKEPLAYPQGAFPSVDPKDLWAGPQLSQWLQARSYPENFWFPCYASAGDFSLNTGATAPFLSYPLLYGGVFQQSLIVGMGYSFFDQVPPTSRFFSLQEQIFSSPYRPEGDPQHYYFDRWGPQRLLDFTFLCEKLQKSISLHPQVDFVRFKEQSAQLLIGLRYAFRERSDPLSVFLQYQNKKEVLHLSHIENNRHVCSYTLPPQSLKRLLSETKGAWLELFYEEKKSRTSLGKIFVSQRPIQEVEDLSALESLVALTYYRRGQEIQSVENIPLYPLTTHRLCVLGILCTLTLLWTVQLLLRWIQWNRSQRLTQLERARFLLEESTPGLVAQIGEALGKPVTSIKAGAFAGYRPFEPGDRLNMAVREDLLLLSIYEEKVVPRMIQRIDERSVQLLLVLSLGRSMSLPAGDLKIRLALAFAELIAEFAWSRGAEVFLQFTGKRTEIPLLGPYTHSPSRGEWENYYLQHQHLPSLSIPVFPVAGDSGMKVIYFSDFLYENLQDFAHQIDILENEGGGFAGVVLSTTGERTSVDYGYAPADCLFFNRLAWTPLDLQYAYQYFHNTLDKILGNYRGGLTFIDSEMQREDLLEVLKESPLTEILR
jgi:hypothetical protein